MPQFDIYKNKNPKSSGEVPYLINLQSDAMDILATRLVAPLRVADEYSDQMLTRIHIPCIIQNRKFIIFLSEMAAVPVSLIGSKVGNLKDLRLQITAAIDLLVTGF